MAPGSRGSSHLRFPAASRVRDNSAGLVDRPQRGVRRTGQAPRTSWRRRRHHDQGVGKRRWMARGPPLQPSQLAAQAVLAVMYALFALAIALWCAGLFAHRVADRRRLAAWDAQWRAIGPNWSRARLIRTREACRWQGQKSRRGHSSAGLVKVMTAEAAPEDQPLALLDLLAPRYDWEARQFCLMGPGVLSDAPVIT